MYPTSAFNPIPMAFHQYPRQQTPSTTLYQSQYGNFNPPQYSTQRGQSLPASNRQYPSTNGSYMPPKYEQYPSPSKQKKSSKPRSISPNDLTDENLYSDKEKPTRSPSRSSVLENQSKTEDTNPNDQEQTSYTNGDISQPTETAPTDEKEQRKSRSKKKKHQQQQQNQYPPSPPPPQQVFYPGYNQDVFRRGGGDIYHNQGRSYPREDDRQKPAYPYPGYTQPLFNRIPQPPASSYNRYQSSYFGYPNWSNIQGVNNNPADQEIQRLRSHIHTLEHKLNKLQKKLNKTTINNEKTRSPRQTPIIVELNNHSTTNTEQSPPSAGNKKQTATENHVDSNERGNQLADIESKSFREQTAAQLAHAAAAHVQARQQVPPPPPIPTQQNNPSLISANYNQSNNNDDIQKRHSAEKILDAFERFYVHKSTTPMKVKYIPEDKLNNHHQQQRNTNNNNNRERSTSDNSSASSTSYSN